MQSFLAEVKISSSWPKTVDYKSQGFWPKLRRFFAALLLAIERCYEAKICAILSLERCYEAKICAILLLLRFTLA